MKNKKSKGHLSLEERQVLYVMHSDGRKDSEIAHILGRDRSVIWRERKRNRPPVYIASSISSLEKAKLAHDKACKRRSDSKRGKKGPLKFFEHQLLIEELLEERRYSPETISDILFRDYQIKLSGKTIRRWVVKERPELRKFFPHRGKPKRNRLTPRKPKTRRAAPVKRSIHERLEVVDNRERTGDFEADAIVCKQAKTAIISVKERQTRRRWFRKVDNLKAATVRSALIQVFGSIPSTLRHTCTYDNGSEFAEFYTLEKYFDLKSFFTDPYCSWQKGAVEQQNKEFRIYVPKGTDLRSVSEEDIARYEFYLNDKPMDCLGKLSSNQAWEIALRNARL